MEFCRVASEQLRSACIDMDKPQKHIEGKKATGGMAKIISFI